MQTRNQNQSNEQQGRSSQQKGQQKNGQQQNNQQERDLKNDDKKNPSRESHTETTSSGPGRQASLNKRQSGPSSKPEEKQVKKGHGKLQYEDDDDDLATDRQWTQRSGKQQQKNA